MLLKLMISMALLLTSATWAGEWPEKPITWYVPGNGGSATDIIARQIAKQVSEKLDQPIVISNHGGAGGTIAASKAAHSPADGYHFLVGGVYLPSAPSLYKDLNFDPIKSFDAVIRWPEVPMVLVVGADSRFKKVGDLIEFGQQKGNEVSLGNAGPGSASFLTAMMFKHESKVEMVSVPYKGNGEALVAVLGSQIHGMFDTVPSVLAGIKSKRLIPLAVTSAKPVPQLSSVPTLASQFPGFNLNVWYGLYAPKGTPSAITAAMHSALLATLKDPVFSQSLIEQGMQMPTENEYRAEAFAAFTMSEILKIKNILGKVISAPP